MDQLLTQPMLFGFLEALNHKFLRKLLTESHEDSSANHKDFPFHNLEEVSWPIVSPRFSGVMGGEVIASPFDLIIILFIFGFWQHIELPIKLWVISLPIPLLKWHLL